MIEEEDDQFTGSSGGGIPVREVNPWPEPEPRTDEIISPRASPEPQTYVAKDTASEDYFATPSTTPLQSTAVIDDETAARYFDEYKRLPPGANKQREDELFRELTRYTEEQPQRQKEDNENFFLKNYTSESSLNELAQDPRIKEREAHSIMPNMERKIALNWSWLQEETGLPISTQMEYEMARNKYSSEHDGIPEPSDQEFFNSRKTQYTHLQERRLMNIDVIGLGLDQARKDELAGNPTDMNAVFERIKAKYSEHFKDPAVAEQTMKMLAIIGEDVKNATNEIRPLVAEAYPILERIATKQGTSEDMKALTTFYKNNPQQFESVLQAASTILHVNDEKVDSGALKTIWDEGQNIGKAFKEGTIGPLVNASRVNQETWVRDQMEMLKDNPDPAAVKLMGDYQTVLDVLDMERALDSFKKREVDPINYHFPKDTWGGRLERGGLGAIQSAPLMAAAWVANAAGTYVGGPVVGMMAADAVMGLATRDQEYEDMRRQGVPHDKAMFWSNASAVAQLPLNHLEFKIDVGRFAALNKTFSAIKDGQLSRLAGLGGRQLAAQTIEWTGEMGQNAMSTLAQTLATQAQQDLPAAEQKVWADAQENGWETFFATLPFTMFGTGVAHFSEESALKLMATESLELLGLSPEAIGRVHAFNNVEEMRQQFSKELKKMTPEDRARGAELTREAQVKAEAAATGMRDDPVMPHLEKEKKPDGTTNYRVVKANGDVAMETTSSTAAEIGLATESNNAKIEEQKAQEEVAASDEGIVAEAEKQATEAILGETVPEEAPAAAAATTAVTAAPASEFKASKAGKKSGRDKVSYEWVVEYLDEAGEITEVDHADTYSEIEARAKETGEQYRIGLVRSIGNEIEGTVQKQWAYVENGNLPESFDDGYGRSVSKVPKEFFQAPAAAKPQAAPQGQVEVTKYDAKAKEFIKVKEKPTKELASELNDQAQVLHNVINCVTRS